MTTNPCAQPRADDAAISASIQFAAPSVKLGESIAYTMTVSNLSDLPYSPAYGHVLMADSASDANWENVPAWGPGPGPCFTNEQYLAPHATVTVTGTFSPADVPDGIAGSYSLGPTTVRLGQISKWPFASRLGGPGGPLTIEPATP